MALFRRTKGGGGSTLALPAVTTGPTPKTKPTYTDILRTPQIHNIKNPRTLGPTFHTADQADQRLYLGAGYDGDQAFNADPSQRPMMGPHTGDTPGFANLTRTKRHPDGTCDAVRLEATQDGWIDLGGPTPRDFKAINW